MLTRVYPQTLSTLPPVTMEHIAAAGMIAICLYMFGILVHKLIGLPVPVAMLFLAVLAKLTYAILPKMEGGARTVYCFFSTVVTYPLLSLQSESLLRRGTTY